MTTAATTQNCAMFHKRFSEILKTSLFKILQNVVTFYQFRATSLQFEQSRKNLERIVHRRTKLCKLFCDCTNCKDVARIGRRLQRFVIFWTSSFSILLQTFCETLHNFVSLRLSFRKIEIFALWYDLFIASPMLSHNNFAQCSEIWCC